MCVVQGAAGGATEDREGRSNQGLLGLLCRGHRNGRRRARVGGGLGSRRGGGERSSPAVWRRTRRGWRKEVGRRVRACATGHGHGGWPGGRSHGGEDAEGEEGEGVV